MRRWIRFLCVMLAVILVSMASRPSVSMAMEPKEPAGPDLRVIAETVQSHVVRQKDGTFALDKSKALELLSAQDLGRLVASMTWVNGQIRSGSLISNNDLTVTFVETGTSVVTSTVRPKGGGVDKFEVFWWGFEFWISADLCLTFALLMGGANVATNFVQAILSRFPNLPAAILSLLMPIVRGLLGFSAMFWGYYASRNGVVERFLWTGNFIGWYAQ